MRRDTLGGSHRSLTTGYQHAKPSLFSMLHTHLPPRRTTACCKHVSTLHDSILHTHMPPRCTTVCCAHTCLHAAPLRRAPARGQAPGIRRRVQQRHRQALLRQVLCGAKSCAQ